MVLCFCRVMFVFTRLCGLAAASACAEMIAACGILAKTSRSLAETGQRKNFQVLDQNETQKLTNNGCCVGLWHVLK